MPTETQEFIQDQIARDEKELETLDKTTTEVYKRIVGYYRATKNWNAGKSEENRHRTEFDNDIALSKVNKVEDGYCETCQIDTSKIDVEVKEEISEDKSGPLVYLVTSPTCPRCPEAKQLIKDTASDLFEAIQIDASTDDGLEFARKYDVMSTPTLLVINNSTVISRASSIEDIEKCIGYIRQSVEINEECTE